MIKLAKDAEDNGLAAMIAELARQNVTDNHEKRRLVYGAVGRVAMIADDGDVAMTIHFRREGIMIHGGVVGIPDVTVRGSTDDLMRLSLLEVVTPYHLPDFRGANMRSVLNSLRNGQLKLYGWAKNLPLLMRVSRLLSVN